MPLKLTVPAALLPFFKVKVLAPLTVPAKVVLPKPLSTVLSVFNTTGLLKAKVALGDTTFPAN